MSDYEVLKTLIEKKTELNSKINLIPFDGTPEKKTIDGKDYIYLRKRIGSKITSTYIDIYSEDLFNKIQRNNIELRRLKKELRKIDKELALLNYEANGLENNVILNIDFARRMVKEVIYDQAVLEGCATTFPQTETILENGIINNVKTSDVMKIINLKHAWEFILDKDLICYPSNFDVLSHISKIVNEGFYEMGGNIRTLPVTITGSSYIPSIPLKDNIIESLNKIINSNISEYEKTIEICLFCMKSQIFIDGNKRTAVIFANHYLISKGKGILAIPYNKVDEFKSLLIKYYENNSEEVKEFLLKECIKKIN